MSIVRQKQMKKRAEIIQKALQLLKNVPFDDITVQDICAAAEISVGSFYHYFEQKGDILVGLVELIDVYMVETVFPKLTHRSALENIREISRGFAEHIVEGGIEQARLVTACRLTVIDEKQLRRPLWLKLTELVSDGQTQGELSALYTPEQTADLLMIAMSGVAVDWARRDGAYSLERRMEDFAELFFRGLSV